MRFTYELNFNTHTGRYEILEVAVQEDGTDYRVNGERMVRQVMSMSTEQWLRFTYTVDGAEDTRTIHEDTQVTHNG